jgi:hypothetical protein
MFVHIIMSMIIYRPVYGIQYIHEENDSMLPRGTIKELRRGRGRGEGQTCHPVRQNYQKN